MFSNIIIMLYIIFILFVYLLINYVIFTQKMLNINLTQNIQLT